MFEAGSRRLRLGVLLIAMLAIASLGMSVAHAAGPFTVAITEPVGTDGLKVSLSGTADSPSHTTHHIVIDWGDTNTDDIQLGDGPGPWNWGPIDHTYAAAGMYTITTTIIHASDQGNDQGESSTDSAVVEVTEPDRCVVNPEAPGCQPPDDDGGETPPPPAPPADEPEVLAKKPLARTAGPATPALWAAVIVILIGATIRFCAVEPAKAEASESPAEDLVAKTLALVDRMVRPRR